MTKERIALGLGGITLALITINFLTIPNWTEAASISIQPSFVVKDNNSNVVGPVVSLESNSAPIVAYEGDLANGRRTLLKFRSATGFQPEEFQVFFANTNCQGQVYLNPPSTRTGLGALTGITYGVGPDNVAGIGGNIWLYRSNSSGPGSSVMYNSLYTTASPDFTNAANCQNSPGTSTLVTATKAVNVTTNFPQPYTAE